MSDKPTVIHNSVVRISPYSRASCKIEMHRLNDAGASVASSSATGFLWFENMTCFIFSNWHVFSGVNPETRKAIGSFVPNFMRVRFFVEKFNEGPEPPIGWNLGSAEMSFPFDEHELESNLAMHPMGPSVDVAAFPFIWHVETEFAPIFLNFLDLDLEHSPEVSDDVFVVGYPEGQTSARSLPIWKRGTVATDLGLKQRGYPEFFIDMVGFKGLSGSPVFCRTGSLAGGPKFSFAGVYAGRLSDENLGATIGRVIDGQILSEIVSNFAIKNKKEFR